MATEQIPTTLIADDAVTNAKIGADAVSTTEIANDASISTSGNIATTGSGTLTVAGASTFSGGIANSGTITAGTIGSNVTIADGASPHGWEHIKTIAYSADTATSSTGTTATKMSNVVSSKYSAYKLVIQWGLQSGTAGKDLYFRFLDTSDAVADGASYFFGYQVISHTAVEGHNFNAGSVSYGMIGNDIGSGSVGFNGELYLFNCFAGQSDFPTIDGHQLTYNARTAAYHPSLYIRQHGYDINSYYQGGTGVVAYNDNLYVSGFLLYFESNVAVGKDSFWSCYGLKSPTAD